MIKTFCDWCHEEIQDDNVQIVLGSRITKNGTVHPDSTNGIYCDMKCAVTAVRETMDDLKANYD